MKKRLLPVALLLGTFAANAQVGIGTATPNKSAELLIQSSNRGLLIPNVALTNSNDTKTITNGNVQSLLVYATTKQGDITPGYYYWDGAKWARLTADKDIPQIVVNEFANILKMDGNKVENLIKGLFKETTTNIIKEKAGKYIYTNEKNEVQNIDIVGDFTEILKGDVYPVFDTVLKQFIDKAETVTSLLYNGNTRTLSYKDENNAVNNIDIAQILKDHTTNTIALNGTTLVSTVNGVEGNTDLTGKISNGMLQAGSVTNDKLSAGKGDDNRVAVADKDGNVTYKTQKEIVEGNTSNELKLEGNSLTSTVNGKTSTVVLTDANVVSSKGIKGTGITVGGGDNSTLKDVTLSVTPGTAGQVMVTSPDGKGTSWVNQGDIVKNNTTNEFTSAGNSMTSNVNGVSKSADIINSIENSLDKDNKLVTTVNGKAGDGLDLTPAIQAGQLKTTVSAKDEKVTVVGTTIDKTTNYVVDVVEAKLDLGKMGGQVGTTQIADGAVITEKIKAGKDGEVLVTITGTDGKTVTKWVSKTDATSNTLEAKGDKLVSTVNGQEGELKLEGDVILKDGKTVVSKLQGNDLTTANVKEGEVLAFEGGKWINKVPTVNTDNVTNGKALSSGSITVVGGEAALLKATQVEVTGGKNAGDVLVTTNTPLKGADGKDIIGIDGKPVYATEWQPAGNLGNTVTAGNGLTKVGNEIKLGGALTEPTTIVSGKGTELAIKGLDEVKTNPTDNNIVLTDPVTGELKQTSAKNLLEDTISKGGTTDELQAKGLKGDGITVTAGTVAGKDVAVANALLKDVVLGIAEGAITEGKLGTNSVTKDKIAEDVAGNGLGKNADGSLEVKAGNGIRIVDDKVTVNAGTGLSFGTDGKLNIDFPTATTDKAGVVKPGKGLDVATDGTLTVNYDTAKTELAKGKVTSSSIVVNEDKGSEGSTFKDVTLEIKGGNADGQVLTSDKDGNVTWTTPEKVATTNDIKIEGGQLVSTVNNVTDSFDLTNQVTKEMLQKGSVTADKLGADAKDAGKVATVNADGTVSYNEIKTADIKDAKNITSKSITVGGDAGSTLKDVTLEIVTGTEGQIMVTGKDGEGKLVTTWVDQLPADKLAPGADGQVLVTEGGKTVWTAPKETVLAGDVTGKVGETVVGGIQGTPVSTTKPNTDGQALVFEKGQWVPGTPNVGVENVTNAKTLTTDGIILVNTDKKSVEKSVLADVNLSIANNAITSDKIKDGEIKTADLGDKAVTPGKVEGGKDGEVLTTIGTGADAKVEWKKPVVDASTVTNGKALTSPEATISITGTDVATALLKDTKIDVANGAITPVKIAAGDNNQVLTTVDNGGVKTVEWKTPEKPATVVGGKTETGDVVVTPVTDPTTGEKEYKLDVKSAMPKVFYMPPVVFDTSDKKNGAEQERDLHQEYLAQFVNVKANLRSGDAPASIPNTVNPTDLHYYVTYHDSSVVEIVSISNDGKLKYKVVGDSTPATFMTIVFVVK